MPHAGICTEVLRLYNCIGAVVRGLSKWIVQVLHLLSKYFVISITASYVCNMTLSLTLKHKISWSYQLLYLLTRCHKCHVMSAPFILQWIAGIRLIFIASVKASYVCMQEQQIIASELN